MKSLFTKNFLMYAAVIVLSFTLLGTLFLYQVGRFSAQEQETQMRKTVDACASMTSAYFTSRMNQGWEDAFGRTYLVGLQQQAKNGDAVIFVGEANGQLLAVATEDYSQYQEKIMLPMTAVNTLLETGSYEDKSTFYDFLNVTCVIRGQLIYGNGERVEGMIFVALPNDNSTTLFFQLSKIFMTMTFLVLLGTLIVTIVIVRSTVKPLKQMARAARSYSRGDFSVRVPLPKRQDELYDMTLSFNHMANAMENIEANRRTMMASVSHDLRTPMTTIAGFVDGILDGTIKPEQQRQYLEIISQEVKRLSRMANSLLSISRLEDGNALQKSTFDLSEMIRRIIISFEKQLAAKEIEGDLTIPESLTVVADHDALFQVVYNLMDNALKFIDQGGTLTVYLEESGGKARFHIINTGGEIPKEQLPHIFERFYKGDSARTGVKNGSGLGLYIVKTVVNKHGGDVYAKSGDGKTEFCFSLPIGKP